MYPADKNKPFGYVLMLLKYTYNIPNNSDKYFWLKYALLKFLCTCILCIEPLLHLVISVTNNTGIAVSENLTVFFGCFAGVMSCFLFTLQYKKWMEFFEDVTYFHHASEYSKSEKRGRLLNFMSLTYFIYCFIGSVIYGLLNTLNIKRCKQMNLDKNLHEICGAFCPIWLPFDVSTVGTIIIFLIQLLAVWLILPACAIITSLTLECTEQVIVHINILNDHFRNLFEEPGEVSEKLRFCVNYHIRILSLGQRLNMLIKYTVGHMSLVAAVIFSVILNEMQREKSLGACLYLSAYVVGIFINCHVGQRILDTTSSTCDAVSASNWYKADPQTMKDLAFVISRSQKPITFDALPLGIHNYPLFMLILKTSYSYLTLLSQTI